MITFQIRNRGVANLYRVPIGKRFVLNDAITVDEYTIGASVVGGVVLILVRLEANLKVSTRDLIVQHLNGTFIIAPDHHQAV